MADIQSKMTEVFSKIEREKVLINAASNMRQSTNNPMVQARLDSNIRDSRRNIGYLEEQMQKLELQHTGNRGPPPPTHGRQGQSNAERSTRDMGNTPPPPPKDGNPSDVPSRKPRHTPSKLGRHTRLGSFGRVTTDKILCFRSDQIRYTLSRTQNPTHAVTT